MGHIWADAGGVLLRVVEHGQEHWGPPAGFAAELVLDDVSNQSLLLGLRTETDRYRLQGGVLTRDGVPVVVAPDSPDKVADDATANERTQLLSQAAAFIDQLTATIDDTTIANDATVTNAEAVAYIKLLDQRQRVLAQGMRRLTRIIVRAVENGRL